MVNPADCRDPANLARERHPGALTQGLATDLPALDFRPFPGALAAPDGGRIATGPAAPYPGPAWEEAGWFPSGNERSSP